MISLSKIQTVLVAVVLLAAGVGAGYLLFHNSDKSPPKTSAKSKSTTSTKTAVKTKYSGACANPDALRDLKFFDDAEKAYKKIAGEQCAVTGLQETKKLKKAAATPKPTADQLIKDARRLRASGFDDLSKAKVKELVEGHPKRKVPTDLRDTDKRLGWWQGVLSNVVPIARVAAEMLIAALIVALALGYGASFLYRVYRRHQGKRDYARVDPVAGTTDTGLAASLPSALVEHLEQLRDKKLGGGVTVGAAEAKFELPAAVSGAFAPANVIVGLLQLLGRLTPQTVRVIVLTLRPADTARGLGVTVEIQETRKRAIRAMTLWENDFGLLDSSAGAAQEAGGRYQRLMLPAAAWLAYQPELGFDEKAIAEGKSEAPLGTTKWRSYAHFAVGAVAQQRANDTLAQAQYLQALDEDPENKGARLNLAQLLLVPPADQPVDQHAPSPSYAKQLQWAIELLAKIAPDSKDNAPDEWWLRGRYTQAVTYLYDDKLGIAEAHVKKLEGALQQKIDDDAVDALRERMKHATKMVGLAIAVALAAEDANKNPPPAKKRPLPEDPRPLPEGEETGQGFYDLACYFAIKFERTQGTAARENALEYLGKAVLRGDPATKREARKDRALMSLRGEAGFDKLTLNPEPAAPKPPGLWEKFEAMFEGAPKD